MSVQVRKEKLGDRITALHQLVSPFGKVISALEFLIFLVQSIGGTYPLGVGLMTGIVYKQILLKIKDIERNINYYFIHILFSINIRC